MIVCMILYYRYWYYCYYYQYCIIYMGMDQYLLIPFLGGWTPIYQLFWCSPGVQGFDTLPYIYICTTVPTINYKTFCIIVWLCMTACTVSTYDSTIISVHIYINYNKIVRMISLYVFIFMHMHTIVCIWLYAYDCLYDVLLGATVRTCACVQVCKSN